MTIEAPDAAPATGDPVNRESPLAGDQAEARIRPSRTSRGTRWRRLWRLGRWTLLLSLMSLNAWWFWRSSRPVVGLDTIATWIEQHHDREAEPALRQRLTRSPHDGAARILLAKLLGQRHDMLALRRSCTGFPSGGQTRGNGCSWRPGLSRRSAG